MSEQHTDYDSPWKEIAEWTDEPDYQQYHTDPLSETIPLILDEYKIKKVDGSGSMIKITTKKL